MGLLDKIGKTLDIWLAEENENYDKGVDFEKMVVELFSLNSKYFAIHEWTRDLSGKHEGVRVESDSNPDLVIRYKPTSEKFAVECKFRSKLYDGKLRWSTREKMEQYNLYSRKYRIPTFIVIGFGGDPASPNRMFCIPLEEAKYPELYPSVYERFERKTGSSFFWRDGVLK
ncbi:MAG: hypothetical protein Q8O41_09075 [Candidatus Methanoperedens sp.]|nr:hypothetical protein [Candidatus Methanoperedens sp.]